MIIWWSYASESGRTKRSCRMWWRSSCLAAGRQERWEKSFFFFSEFSNSFLQSTFIKQMKILHSEEKEKVCQQLNINPSFFLIFINCFASPLDISYVCFPNLLLHIQGHNMFNVRLFIYLGVDWGRNEESTSRHSEQCGGVPPGFIIITTWKFCSGLIKLIMAKSCSPSGSAGGSAEALGWESLLLFFYFVDIINIHSPDILLKIYLYPRYIHCQYFDVAQRWGPW